jgi:uncharacterized membrane protein (DUF485 family)
MTEEPRLSLSSSGWTGLPPEDRSPYREFRQNYKPPVDRQRAIQLTIAALLGFGFFGAYGGWWAMLSFHSPYVATPATGHTMALPFPIGRGPAHPIYVRPLEGWVAVGLGLLGLAAPGLYLAWKGYFRRMP